MSTTVDGEALQKLADRFRYEVAELVATSRALSSERDIRKLLALILEKSRQVTGADAGSVYVLEEEDGALVAAPGPTTSNERRLHFMMSQNDSLKIDFQEFTLGVDEKSIVGKAVLTGRPINIPDLYKLSDPNHNPWGFQHNRSFDEKTGYRARSMLTVPMLSAESEVIGVIQLINKKRDASRPLTSPSQFDTEVVPFDERSEEFALALASQAGLSLENAMLYEEIKDLFEGFVDASVQAIESRDPTTSGHSRRVATLSVALAARVDAITDGPLADVRFSPTSLKQLEYAGVLHDFGKVGVREKVLVKAKKLYDEDREKIRMRFAYIRKAIECEAAERKLRIATELSREDHPARFAEADAELARKLGDLDSAWAFILKANEPTVLEEGGLERLVEIGQMVYMGLENEPKPYIEREEVAALQIRRGSLTDVERVEIESHVVHTYNFLKKIPWGKRFADVPRIAGAHHEYLNGGGYPRHLPAGDIPVEARIMTIADIFDALTASDRPYKKAVPIDRALGIIESEVKAGKCDPVLFKVFVEAEVYKKVL
ncbi:MAG TPA: HD domain-containing phosphohydrolase [Polyangia bacterium]|nr:HD domain-containing phosphohydrolase [Polyangia bacterium]